MRPSTLCGCGGAVFGVAVSSVERFASCAGDSRRGQPASCLMHTSSIRIPSRACASAP